MTVFIYWSCKFSDHKKTVKRQYILFISTCTKYELAVYCKEAITSFKIHGFIGNRESTAPVLFNLANICLTMKFCVGSAIFLILCSKLKS